LGRHSQKLLDGVLALIPSEPRSFVVTTCLLHSPLDGEIDLSTLLLKLPIQKQNISIKYKHFELKKFFSSIWLETNEFVNNKKKINLSFSISCVPDLVRSFILFVSG
jgi:hypothetical protein